MATQVNPLPPWAASFAMGFAVVSIWKEPLMRRRTAEWVVRTGCPTRADSEELPTCGPARPMVQVQVPEGVAPGGMCAFVMPYGGTASVDEARWHHPHRL